MKNKRQQISKKFDLPQPKAWKGYSFEELQYRRAVVATKIEFTKYKITSEAQNVKNGLPAFGGRLIKMCFASLNYFDYILLAVKAFSKIRQMFKKN